MLRPVPGLDVEASNVTTCSTSGVIGENVNAATVGSGMVDVVVVVVVVDVVVSVIFTTPGPTGGEFWQPSTTAAARTGAANNSLRMGYIVILMPATGVTFECS